MEKTTVDFILVASSIYHCFSFWICLWWCQMLTPSDLRQPALSLPGMYCRWLSPSVVNLVTLHSAVRHKHQRAGAESLLGAGLLFPLRLLRLGGEWSAWARWLPPFGGWLSTGIPAATLSALSPKLPSRLSSGVSGLLGPRLCRNPG